MDYSNRHVVVTGGTGALGSAVVRALVEAGAFCHVPYIHAAEAERFDLRTHAQVKLIANIELSDETGVARLYSGLPQLWASIHIAGGFAMSPVAGTTKSDLMAQVDMNFVTAFLCCAAAVRAMAGTGGRIVNVATRPALEWRSGAGMAAYTASILVNAIAPSTMDTPANRQAMPNADHAAWAKVEDVAATIMFLASPQNRVTRGAVVPVYGRS